ncbi:hypothetical protein EUX98_g7456 [Antrodiella citrinella]|uniref:DUF6589 domain-containing protein n=1 Tax=Antrodiella citrinella TaxID=2447956 RepID=A0A4S4MLH6_9APHY|nr:hypothetical protein EUX98_g7456 [Antrodiella citrinella]
MPTYNTVYRTLEHLADHEAKIVREHGKDPTTHGDICFDNLQHNIRQRDVRLGRETIVNIGIAATYYEIPDVDLKAFDIEDKRRRLQEGKRKDLTVEQLLGFVDDKHRETVGMLQWLRVLTNYVPALQPYKEHISMLYRTRGAKQQLPICATTIHPLATCQKNETIITELKDAIVDFLDQTGQTSEEHHKRLILFHGDGLSYNVLLSLKQYLQFQDNEFERCEIIEPVLAMWHTAWTNLSRIFETHWGELSRCDPSTLSYLLQFSL